jgi:hypothetical protein
MALVPADDLPSGLVPADDLPDVGRKTPKQMRGDAQELLPPLVSGRLGIHGPREFRKEDPGSMVRGLSEFPERAGFGVTDLLAKSPATRPLAAPAGYATSLALEALPSLFPGAKPAEIALKDVVKMQTLKEGRNLGLNVPPSAVGSGHVERGIESLGGKADIGREISSRNREAVQVIARREAGLAPDAPITEGTLEAARHQLSLPYRQISALSNKAAQALEKLKSARIDAKDLWSKYGREPDPATRRLAMKADLNVDRLEGVISNEAGELTPNLLPALKQARVNIAKNYDIEKALNVGTGEIDARVIGRMVDKRGTKAVTGDLQTVGKFAQAFPDFVQPKDVARDVSALRPYLALGALGGGGALSEHYTGTPYGMALGALPFISPAARGLALSKLMQSGALGPGASASRVGAASLIPLSRLGTQDDDAGR